MKYLFLGSIMFLTTPSPAQTPYDDLNKLVLAGEFTQAGTLIDAMLKKNTLAGTAAAELLFEKEKMDRIRKDFTKTSEDVLAELGKYYPGIKAGELEKWEKDGSLEFKTIDGRKWYFARAASNLFRINKEAKKRKELADGYSKDALEAFLEGYVPQALEEAGRSGRSLVKPVVFHFDFTITVDTDAIPDGETIRCWLPYPREGHGRQAGVKLLGVNSKTYIIADNEHPQRSIYIEKPAVKGQATVFNAVFETTNYSEVHEIRPELVKAYDKSSALFANYTAERKPHIFFSARIKKLSKEIAGDEKNPYLIARKIFAWVSENIPWAGAREYSTIENISDYGLANRHGDCGIQTLVFVTLARYNGIPARWQSGWMLHPGKVNLHDWGEIYLEGYGWVPVDQSLGLLKTGTDREKYFFLGSVDPYHLIVNDDYSVPLFPAKTFPRSETVDFQRGEVEWRGGNLYFDKWNYDMKVEYKPVERTPAH
jgi:transglutaminase-like putative cysteine protease